MKEARHLIEKKKREVEDLLLLVLAKAANYAHHPHFDKNEALHNCAKHLQQAGHALFMAGICLMEKS